MLFRKRKRRRKIPKSNTKHYLEYKEQARELVLARLLYFNQHYNFSWNRVSIKNQRRCWGSCSSLKNLNFNYKLLLLPPHLQDYIIVHEMCHLSELNHGKDFWQLVARAIPNYKKNVVELKVIDRGGGSITYLERVKKIYEEIASAQDLQVLNLSDEIFVTTISSNNYSK